MVSGHKVACPVIWPGDSQLLEVKVSTAYLLITATFFLVVASMIFLQTGCEASASFGLTYNFKSSSVTAPSEALVTWAAYFASTPRV